MMKTRFTLAALAAATLVLTGCSGPSNEPDPTETPVATSATSTETEDALPTRVPGLINYTGAQAAESLDRIEVEYTYTEMSSGNELDAATAADRIVIKTYPEAGEEFSEYQRSMVLFVRNDDTATAAPAPTADAVDTSRDAQVLALAMVLNESSSKTALCDGYAELGADLTAASINVELDEADAFPTDVVAEVFDANCP